MRNCGAVRWQHQAAPWLARKQFDLTLDVSPGLNVDRDRFEGQRRCRGTHGSEEVVKVGLARVAYEPHSTKSWRYLFQHCQPFARNTCLEIHEAGEVAARLRQAGNEACPDRIRNSDEHNRYCLASCPLRGGYDMRGICKNDIRLECDQFFCVCLQLTCSVAITAL